MLLYVGVLRLPVDDFIEPSSGVERRATVCLRVFAEHGPELHYLRQHGNYRVGVSRAFPALRVVLAHLDGVALQVLEAEGTLPRDEFVAGIPVGCEYSPEIPYDAFCDRRPAGVRADVDDEVPGYEHPGIAVAAVDAPPRLVPLGERGGSDDFAGPVTHGLQYPGHAGERAKQRSLVHAESARHHPRRNTVEVEVRGGTGYNRVRVAAPVHDTADFRAHGTPAPPAVHGPRAVSPHIGLDGVGHDDVARLVPVERRIHKLPSAVRAGSGRRNVNALLRLAELLPPVPLVAVPRAADAAHPLRLVDRLGGRGLQQPACRGGRLAERLLKRRPAGLAELLAQSGVLPLEARDVLLKPRDPRDGVNVLLAVAALGATLIRHRLLPLGTGRATFRSRPGTARPCARSRSRAGRASRVPA